MTETEPVMKQHVSILGILYIIFGALGLVGAIAALVVFGGAAGILSIVAQHEPDAAVAVPIVAIFAVAVFVIVSFLSIPGLVVGVGLVKFQPWARIGGLILSAINILNFPIGTALGVYGLWVLLSKETETLFT